MPLRRIVGLFTLAGTIAAGCSPSNRRDQYYGTDAYSTYTPPEAHDAAPDADAGDAGVTDAVSLDAASEEEGD
jgi:hypothetical protein